MSASSADAPEINENQFITLNILKDRRGFTDDQDDSTLLGIVQSANNEVKKQIITVVDDILAIENTKFFGRASDAAFTFCVSRIKRDINEMFDEAKKIMDDFNAEMASLLGDIRATAPVRTSTQVITRDVPFEDDYFAERHIA